MRGEVTPEVEMDAKVVRRDLVADDVVRLVLRHSFGGPFPGWEPGAHIDLILDDGLVRQYSLCGDPADRSVLEIAVLRESQGRGGSAFVHEKLLEGARVRIRGPRNHFPLGPAGEYLFIAGGIGITPIRPMIGTVAASGRPWRLVYGGRSRSSMAFRDELTGRYGNRVSIRPQDEFGLLDLDSLLAQAEAEIYCCGPEPLLKAVESRVAARGRLHVERFAPKSGVPETVSGAFEIELASTGQTLTVPADRTIVQVLEDEGIDVGVSCLEGTCGTCETAVLDGVPDHRDSILTEEEQAQNDTMFICVSRSRTPKLRLDR